MLIWLKTNTEALFDVMRYKRYQLAFRYYRRRARKDKMYTMRADTCLDKMDGIIDKWEAIARGIIE